MEHGCYNTPMFHNDNNTNLDDSNRIDLWIAVVGCLGTIAAATGPALVQWAKEHHQRKHGNIEKKKANNSSKKEA